MIEGRSFCRHVVQQSRLDGHLHVGWDNSLPPILEVSPGDEVFVDCVDASGGVLNRHSVAADLELLTPAVVNATTGPLAIAGARPGQTLVIEILDFMPGCWGWTALIPGFGLLADEFPEPCLNISRLRDGSIDFADGLILPLRPFAGTMGLAPARPGRHDVIPPHASGGNMDVRHLVAGTTLYLPIQVPDALFSVGDTHAAQGDGEVCGTAIEAPMGAVMRFSLSDRGISAPEYSLPPFARVPDPAGYHATVGMGSDLHEAAREAVRRMVDCLQSRHGLRAECAYMLCSVAGDLSISEIVNRPNYLVSMQMPLSIFG